MHGENLKSEYIVTENLIAVRQKRLNWTRRHEIYVQRTPRYWQVGMTCSQVVSRQWITDGLKAPTKT